MEINRKRKKDGHVHEEPTLTPLPIWSSETESDNIDIFMDKTRNELNMERVISKRNQESIKKSLVKKESVSKRSTLKSKHVNGPSPHV